MKGERFGNIFGKRKKIKLLQKECAKMVRFTRFYSVDNFGARFNPVGNKENSI